jgi:hypothetical protein
MTDPAPREVGPFSDGALTGPRVIGLFVMCNVPAARVAGLVGTRQGTVKRTWDQDTAPQ